MSGVDSCGYGFDPEDGVDAVLDLADVGVGFGVGVGEEEIAVVVGCDAQLSLGDAEDEAAEDTDGGCLACDEVDVAVGGCVSGEQGRDLAGGQVFGDGEGGAGGVSEVDGVACEVVGCCDGGVDVCRAGEKVLLIELEAGLDVEAVGKPAGAGGSDGQRNDVLPGVDPPLLLRAAVGDGGVGNDVTGGEDATDPATGTGAGRRFDEANVGGGRGDGLPGPEDVGEAVECEGDARGDVFDEGARGPRPGGERGVLLRQLGGVRFGIFAVSAEERLGRVERLEAIADRRELRVGECDTGCFGGGVVVLRRLGLAHVDAS